MVETFLFAHHVVVLCQIHTLCFATRECDELFRFLLQQEIN